MPRYPKEIVEFMTKYKVSDDEVWPVPGGKSYAVKHKALERVAAQLGISFERPSVIACDLNLKSAVFCVFGKLNDRTEWSFGEASPANNKNAYFAAMTEKRARDRVILKLLNLHGDLYSEDEAEEFKRPNPHVTRPEDVFELPEYDSNGQPVDNIPAPDPDSVRKIKVADQRPIFETLQNEIWKTGTVEELQEWAQTNKNRLGVIKPDWQEMLRGVYAEHLNGLRDLARGDEARMAG